MATLAHNTNSISSITTQDGILVIDHEQKASLLWDAFKNRMVLSQFSGISYNLGFFLQNHQLDFLADDFNEAKIDSVKSSIRKSHAPGPDGYNGLFIKKWWPIIKQDFLRLFKDFSDNSIDLTSINSSLIALVPKRSNPYMPISLLAATTKVSPHFLTKPRMPAAIAPTRRAMGRGGTNRAQKNWDIEPSLEINF